MIDPLKNDKERFPDLDNDIFTDNNMYNKYYKLALSSNQPIDLHTLINELRNVEKEYGNMKVTTEYRYERGRVNEGLPMSLKNDKNKYTLTLG